MSAPLIYLLGGSLLERRAYRALLRVEAGLEVAIASNFEAVSVWKCLREKPTHAIVSAGVPDTSVRDTLHMIAKLAPDLRVLVISLAFDPEQVRQWADCTFHCYLIKDSEPAEFVTAVRAFLNGDSHFSDGVLETLRAARESRRAGANQLSRRESELLPLLARGLSLRDAAREMTVSYKTADSYRTSLMRKLGVRDRVELARYAIRMGIVDA